MVEIQSFTSTGELISRTQVYNPKRPISICFDVRTVIAKNSIYRPQGIGNTCRGLAREKIYICQMISICGGKAVAHVIML
jgi:hypothetical protein